jgi:hypothetical protein
VINKDILRDIRNKEMDRKTFLKYCGVTILGLVGLKTAVNLLSELDNKKSVSNSKGSSTSGFGGGKYGA